MSTPNPQQETELADALETIDIVDQLVHSLTRFHIPDYPEATIAINKIDKLINSRLKRYAKAVDDEVVGSKNPSIREYYGDKVNVDMQVDEMFRNEMSGRNVLRREQRQAHAAIRERFGIGK